LYFKKLEVFGFKSFPERTKLVFEPGITAIVGPNGCGKTNVADAIRWVLGEQSALALRGSRMEDVIFNGSVGRKPLGIAEVSLTLSNPENFLPLEYSEVTITRRVFRSGESEYFINRTPCRLRDIKELFMDTGIGTEAYSLIGQGKIDLVLSSKPDDRRYLFEEVAGITRYKERKRTALRKLEATEQNLIRVSDIVSEVKRQIGSLKRQVRKAERYQETFEGLKELEIKSALAEWSRMKEEEALSLEEAKRVKDEREKLSANLSEGDSRLEELRIKLLDLEKVLMERQEKSKELTAIINQTESHVLLLRERREGLSRDKKRAGGELGNIEEKLSQLQKEIKEKEAELSRLSQEREEREAKVEEGKKSLDEISRSIEKEERETEENKATVVEIVSREAKVKNNLAGLKVTLENLSARKRRLKVVEEQGRIEKEKVEERVKVLSTSLEEKRALLEEMKREQAKLQDRIAAFHSQLSVLRDKLNSQRDELVASSSRLDFLQDLKRRFEGYQAGVKAVLQNRERFPGVRGTVADLIDFPAELEMALEAALGGSVQNIVIETAGAAEEFIIYLREERKGRATFLPLDSLRGYENFPMESVVRWEGVVGTAFNLVKFDPVYKEVFSCLLGRTVVVEDLGKAKSIVQSLQEKSSSSGIGSSLDLVTLKGELISWRGVVSGGSKVKGGGLLRRDRKIEELRGKTESLKKAVSKMEAEEKVVLEDIEKLSRELEILEGKRRRQELEKAGLENDYSSVEEEKIRKEREISLLQSELREVEDDEERAGKEKEELSKELEELEQRNEVVQERIIFLQQLIEKEKDRQAELSREFTQYRVELASWEEKERSERSNLSRLKESFKECIEAQSSRFAEIEEADRRRVEIDKEEEEKEKVLKELFEKRDLLAGEIEKDAGERRKIISTVNEVEKELKDRRSRLGEIQDKIHSLDLHNSQLEMKMEGLKNRLSSEYQVSLEALFQERKAEKIDEETVSLKIAELRARLETMGPVNLVAIDENKELEERYNFLIEQLEDLIQAKESLQKVIAKINRTTRSLFMESFEQVREHFNTLFRTLFGGGRADLALVDESDILESGIDVIAQPPGKKLQSISLLSGGERALTAIALLFALFRVKPSPFCLLDEIDAPLDESNINRFNGLLQEFTSQSQFIIITHNKRTIAMANVMYGVTMEESGVSKLVSVRFQEGEKDKGVTKDALLDKERKEANV